MCDEKAESCCNESEGLCRLPEGYSMEDLFKIKGVWPTRELSQQELMETYKDHFSFNIRREYYATVAALKERFGDEVYDVVEEISYKTGYECGKEQRKIKKTMANCLVDIAVRPFCYKIEQIENSKEKMVYRILECSTATIAKDMGLEELVSHICPKWHQGFADGFGAKFEMTEFLLDGDDCCKQIWEELQ